MTTRAQDPDFQVMTAEPERSPAVIVYLVAALLLALVVALLIMAWVKPDGAWLCLIVAGLIAGLAVGQVKR